MHNLEKNEDKTVLASTKQILNQFLRKFGML
jgi:hypothetical protein